MVLIAAFKRVVAESYAKFDGRSGRAEFWWFFLANLIVGVVLSLLGQASTFFYIIYVIYGLALFIPSIAVGIRRLHDINRTGWWILIALVPLVGLIVLLVFYATAGDRGTNQFGPEPIPLATA
jgi:uncharacterized membrane protein YhaH (DUF805 family)